MNNKPVFSVVMPMYNVEKYIDAAVTSVLEQSYANFELICVDDGCSDSTLQCLEKFDDPRIRLIQQKNRGLAGARNTGINHAHGLYVALLDSDDIWHKDKLKRHFQHFSSNASLGVSYSASEFIDEAGQPMGIGQYPKLYDIQPQDVMCRNPIGNGSAPVFKKSVLMQISQRLDHRTVYFDESLRQSEDIELWTRIALTTHVQFEGIGEALTYYRVNDGGLSANIDAQFASWQKAMMGNRDNNPDLFDQYFDLAKAYQLRYLARRAIRSRSGRQAIRLMVQALSTNWRILTLEPKRTIVTCCAALLALLPRSLFSQLERMAMVAVSRAS